MPDNLNPWLAKNRMSGDEYDAQYEGDNAVGKNVHGEADFVEAYGVQSVLDAGCGTGRVGRELARRGLDVVGVDLDETLLQTARRKYRPRRGTAFASCARSFAFCPNARRDS